MVDNVSIQRIAKLHPRLRSEVADVLAEIQAKGVSIRITQGLRTFAEQDALYAQGRTKPGNKVTNAKGGQSYHNFGIAIDFCLVHKDGSISWDMKEDLDGDKIADWKEVVDAFEKYGWSWGGHWKTPDTPHFEKTFGYNFRQLVEMPKDKDGYVIL